MFIGVFCITLGVMAFEEVNIGEEDAVVLRKELETNIPVSIKGANPVQVGTILVEIVIDGVKPIEYLKLDSLFPGHKLVGGTGGSPALKVKLVNKETGEELKAFEFDVSGLTSDIQEIIYEDPKTGKKYPIDVLVERIAGGIYINGEFDSIDEVHVMGWASDAYAQ